MSGTLVRCSWPVKPLDVRYHDEEWGVPVHDDRVLFEFLVLEGAQAGLSWSTILAKRENYRAALDGFDPERIARYRPARIDRLMTNAGLVRHRQKLESVVSNAKAFLDVREQHGSFDTFLWQFVDGTPVCNRPRRPSDVPARTLLSDTISKELSRRGFRFVGSTIMYAYLQAVGVVNDHLTTCFRHAELSGGTRGSAPPEGSPKR